MTTQIKIKRSTNASPTVVTTFGELALTNPGSGSTVNLYAGNSAGTPVLIGGTSFAPLASPTFTGTPSAPTALAGTNTTQLATTAFVTGAITASKALAQGQILVGNSSGVETATSFSAGQVLLGTTSTGYATPTTVTGDVTITGAGVTTIGNNVVTGSKIASATITSANIAAATITGSNIAATTITGSNLVNATVTGTQIASSVALAGSPTTTTQTAGDNSTKIATTAYVDTLASANIKVGNASGVATAVTLSGDATMTNGGVVTIANNAVTNAKAAQAGANTWKGNKTGSTADVSDNPSGALTEATSNVLTITGGANALLNATSIQVNQSSGSQAGYLSSTDWTTFNNKMPTVSSPTANDILLTNGSGQAIDSGYQIETTLSGSSTKLPNSAAVQTAIQASQYGLSAKQSVLAATATALPAVTAAGSGATKTLTANANGVLSVDGISSWIDVTVNGGSTNPNATSGTIASRVLVQNQVNAADNGIYVVTTAGTLTTKFVLTRALDANNSLEFTNGMFVFALSGTVNANAGFVCTNSGTVTLETTAINFTQFSGAGAIIAGTGLTKSGNTISIATGGVTNTLIASSTILGSNIAAATITGSNIAATTITGSNLVNATVTGTQIASSVALAGSPTTTTQTAGDNSTKIATTAYVDTLASANIKVGNASGVATAVTLSGDATMSNAGALTIAAGAVTGSKIAATTITASNIVNATITSTQLANSIFSSTGGLTGGAGTAVAIKPDSTTGATVCPITLSANGAGITVDNSSIIQTSGTVSVALIDGGIF